MLKLTIVALVAAIAVAAAFTQSVARVSACVVVELTVDWDCRVKLHSMPRTRDTLRQQGLIVINRYGVGNGTNIPIM